MISIWRWAVLDDLDTRFAALVAAAAEDFADVARAVLHDQDNASQEADQALRDTEARLKAMDLPADVMATMLRGFQSMIAEQSADREADAPGPDGTWAAALASSHMLRHDPYASLSQDDIDQQVSDLIGAYHDAISTAVGQRGQSLAHYLGVAPDLLSQGDLSDALAAAEQNAVVWLWATPDAVFTLRRWQEDDNLPIDLELARTPLAAFEALKKLG